MKKNIKKIITAVILTILLLIFIIGIWISVSFDQYALIGPNDSRRLPKDLFVNFDDEYDSKLGLMLIKASIYPIE